MSEKSSTLKTLFNDITPEIWAEVLAEHEEQERTYVARMQALKDNADKR